MAQSRVSNLVVAKELHPNALGGGSLTTIYKYLTKWEAGRPKTAPAASAAEIPDQVQNAFAGTWRAATMEAARQTEAAKEKAAEEVKAAQKKFEEALEGIERLEAQSEQDAAQIDKLKKRVAELEAALTAAGNDNAALKATAEQLRQQVKSQQVELERLRVQLTESQKKSDQAQFKLEQAEKQIAETTEQLQTAQQKQETVNKEREEAIKEAAELKGQAQTLKAQNSELMAKLSERAAPKKA